jgi:shikimate dehydrogenase
METNKNSMHKLGLLGRNISYSFSKHYFKTKFENENINNVTYSNFDIEAITKFEDIVKNTEGLKGLNVTIPYKEEVILYLDKLNKKAKAIGAVNTIKVTKKGKLVGYNTDCYGFIKSLKPYLKKRHKKALILGTGGASKIIKKHQIIVNCTPLGTFPNVENCPNIPYEAITDKHILYDLIYNPEETTFLNYGKQKGAITINGLNMLKLQAEKAWSIWNIVS